VLLATSNGAGMGHLSRLLSVGLGLGERAECTFFSLSLGLPTVLPLGLPGEYCPSYDRGWMPERSWNSYLRDRIVALAVELDIDVFLFDGVSPYPGIVNSRPLLPEVAFVWVRRGMWQPGTGAKQLARSMAFDLIVEPGDLAQSADRGPTSTREDAVKVPPISMVEVIDRLPRETAAVELGLDPGRPTVLVTLGSGRLGNVRGPGAIVLESLLEDARWQVAVTRAAIALDGIPLGDSDRVVEMRGVYPLVRYLGAFDAVVSSAGYNAVHEFLPVGLPTLLVPNAATRTDDQIARARFLSERGMALYAAEDDDAALVAGAKALSDAEVCARLSEACRSGAGVGGASATGSVVVDLAARFVPSRRMRLARSLHLFDAAWREWLKRRLGPRVTDRVRRMLGRPPMSGIAADMVVSPTDDPAAFTSGASPTPLLVTPAVTNDIIRLGPPVEHVLEGTSEAYRAARMSIIDRYYDVVHDGRR
jgi:hypothetical protein